MVFIRNSLGTSDAQHSVTSLPLHIFGLRILNGVMLLHYDAPLRQAGVPILPILTKSDLLSPEELAQSHAIVQECLVALLKHAFAPAIPAGGPLTCAVFFAGTVGSNG